MKVLGACEYGLILYRNKLPKFNNADETGERRMIKNWFEFKRDGKDIPRIHPTQKPVNLLKQLISIEGQQRGEKSGECTEMKHMKHMTYNNLMAVIRKIQKKGYDFETSERLVRSVFAEFEAAPQGLNIEQRIERILDYEEWLRQ